MLSRKRWAKAQTYEKSFWQNIANEIITKASNRLDWYSWKAGQLEQKIKKCFQFPNKVSCKILEIGSGPIGIVSFLDWGEKYAIDPLERFFSENQALIQLRNKNVRYLNGQGENLPFKNNDFSIIIIDNVIDHTHVPLKVLRESYRILKNNGLLFFTVNTHTRWGTILHAIVSSLHIDRGHPHSFSYKGVRSFLRSGQFVIVYEELEDYKQIKNKYCTSKNLKDRVKGYSGLSEILYTAICRKV